MEIKYDVSITAIGNLARTFLENNKSAILLDEGIRPNLSDMVIEHTPGKLEEDIKKGFSCMARPVFSFTICLILS